MSFKSLSTVSILWLAAITLCLAVGNVSASTISKTNSAINYTSQTHEQPNLKSVNGRIEVGDGLKVGDVKTTNGRIRLGDEVVAKDVRTTNGSIAVGRGGTLDSVRSTNGSLSIEGGKVKGDVRTTNGAIRIEDESVIEGNVISANGHIELDEAKVKDNVELSNGRMDLRRAEIGGDVVIHERRGSSWFGRHKKPVVVIGAETVVKGDIIARQEIELFVHESAKVGNIVGAEAQTFSGRNP